MTAHRPVVGHHLVVDARQRPVARQQFRDQIVVFASLLESGGHDERLFGSLWCGHAANAGDAPCERIAVDG